MKRNFCAIVEGTLMPKNSLRIQFIAATKKHHDAQESSIKKYCSASKKIRDIFSSIYPQGFDEIIYSEFIFKYRLEKTNSLELIKTLSESSDHNFQKSDTQAKLKKIVLNMEITISHEKLYSSFNEIKTFDRKVISPINAQIENLKDDLIDYESDIHKARNALIQIKDFIQYINSSKLKKWEQRAVHRLNLDAITSPTPDFQAIMDLVSASIQARDSMNSAIDVLKEIQGSFFK